MLAILSGTDIYDQRDKPAYERFEVNPQYAENRHILKWWTTDHDALLAQLVAEKRWVWFWYATDGIVKLTDTKQIDTWKANDPLCKSYAWYNVLMYFAVARAQQLRITQNTRRPRWKRCLLCKEKFIEDSLPVPLIERLGVDELDFCAPCLRRAVLQGSGSDTAARRTVLKYLKKLSDVIGRVPPQNFGEGIADLRDLSRGNRVSLLRLLQNKPTAKCVKSHFGSWLNALIKAGVLEDGTRKTSRGIQTIAIDGHVCLSLGEKTIDDFMHKRGIRHVKEPGYPEGGYRADFKVGDVLIEYFGLAGNPDYDKKIREKTRICKEHGIALIAIYAKDLMSQERLEDKLSSLVVENAANTTLNRTRKKPRAG